MSDIRNKTINSTHKGIVTAITMVIAAVILFYFFHLPEKGLSQFFVISIYFLGIIWTIFSNKSNTNLTRFKDYFSEGFKAFIAVTFIWIIFTFIFYRINPQILENVINENNSILAKEGNRTLEEIKINEEKLRRNFMPIMLSFTTVMYLFFGALVSLVCSVVISKKGNINPSITKR